LTIWQSAIWWSAILKSAQIVAPHFSTPMRMTANFFSTDEKKLVDCHWEINQIHIRAVSHLHTRLWSFVTGKKCFTCILCLNIRTRLQKLRN
jgi:hypothetical protein